MSFSTKHILKGVSDPPFEGEQTDFDYVRSLNKFRGYLNESFVCDGLYEALINDSTIINDVDLGDQSIESANVLAWIDSPYEQIHVQLSEDSFQLIKSELDAIFDGLPDNQKQINFTDEQGNVYSIIDKTGYGYIFWNQYIDNDISNPSDIAKFKVFDQRYESGTYFRFINTILWSINGTSCITLMNLVSQLAKSSTYNFILEKAADLVLATNFSISDFISMCKNTIGDLYESNQEITNLICDTYTKSGNVGVAQLLLAFPKVGSTATTTQDDKVTFDFTDNNLYVPQQYIVGMIPGIISTVSAAVGLIASAFNVVLGAVVIAVGQLASAIVNHFVSDYQSTNCNFISQALSIDNMRIINGGAVDVFPHGFFRGYELLLKSDDLYQYIITSAPFMVNVPGGVLYVSYKETNAIPNAIEVQYEFHPSIDWCEDGLGADVLDDIHQPIYQDVPITSDPDWERWYTYIDFSKFNNRNVDGANGVVSKYIKLPKPVVMTDRIDTLVRVTMMHNIGLFLAYAYSFNTASVQSISGQCRFPGFIKSINNNYSYLETPTDYNITSSCLGLSGLRYEDADALVNIIVLNNSHIPSWSDLASFAGLDVLSSVYFGGYGPIKYNDGAPNRVISGWNNPVNLPSNGVAIYTGFKGSNLLKSVYGYAMPFPSNEVFYPIQTPSYDKSTFFFWIAVVVGASALATAAIVGMSVAGKRALNKMRAKRNRDIEKAWNNYVNSGSTEDYKAYAKLVQKNNRMPAFISSTKYNGAGYWLSEGSSNTSNVIESVMKVNKLILGQDDSNDESLNLTQLRKYLTNIIVGQ